MLHLSDFTSERLVNESLALFKRNLGDQLITDVHVRYMSNAKTLLQHEVFPKLAFLSGMITEPLVINDVEVLSNETLLIDEMKCYRFASDDSIFFTVLRTPKSFNLIYGEIQLDNSVKVELFMFNHDKYLVGVQNHHYKRFDIISDFSNKVVLQSSVGSHIFYSAEGMAHSHKHHSRYVPQPLQTNATVEQFNPFKEAVK